MVKVLTMRRMAWQKLTTIKLLLPLLTDSSVPEEELLIFAVSDF
jgi:hypothetical protein